MSTMAGNIRAQLVTELASVTTAGGYHYDLNATDQVITGYYDEPPIKGLACVMLAHWSVTTEDGPPLSQETIRSTITLVCWAPITADTLAARATAAEQIASDVCSIVRKATRQSSGGIKALAAMTNGSKVLDVRLEVEPVDVYDGGHPGWGRVAVMAEFVYRLDGNTGGI